jgi:TPR repeat protein
MYETSESPRSASAPEADGASRIAKATSPPSAQKLPEHPQQTSELTSDPTELWAEVKNESSEAEVELARLYIEGTAVPKNCAQAQLLLLAASRKGNARANGVLGDYGNQCP